MAITLSPCWELSGSGPPSAPAVVATVHTPLLEATVVNRDSKLPSLPRSTATVTVAPGSAVPERVGAGRLVSSGLVITGCAGAVTSIATGREAVAPTLPAGSVAVADTAWLLVGMSAVASASAHCPAALVVAVPVNVPQTTWTVLPGSAVPLSVSPCVRSATLTRSSPPTTLIVGAAGAVASIAKVVRVTSLTLRAASVARTS